MNSQTRVRPSDHSPLPNSQAAQASSRVGGLMDRLVPVEQTDDLSGPSEQVASVEVSMYRLEPMRVVEVPNPACKVRIALGDWPARDGTCARWPGNEAHTRQAPMKTGQEVGGLVELVAIVVVDPLAFDEGPDRHRSTAYSNHGRASSGRERSDRLGDRSSGGNSDLVAPLQLLARAPRRPDANDVRSDPERRRLLTTEQPITTYTRVDIPHSPDDVADRVGEWSVYIRHREDSRAACRHCEAHRTQTADLPPKPVQRSPSPSATNRSA